MIIELRFPAVGIRVTVPQGFESQLSELYCWAWSSTMGQRKYSIETSPILRVRNFIIFGIDTSSILIQDLMPHKPTVQLPKIISLVVFFRDLEWRMGCVIGRGNFP